MSHEKIGQPSNLTSPLKIFPLYLLALSIYVLTLVPACESERVDARAAAAAAVAPALGEDFKFVSTDNVPLYGSEPQQLGLPNAMLEKGSRVRVIRTEFGYSLVETQVGDLGWVANEDLDETPIAAATFD
jgi:hypothetical protein